MFVLEYKQFYIVRSDLTKNRTCQTYRWKQAAIFEDASVLESIRSSKSRPDEWRVVPLGSSVFSKSE